MQSYYCLLNLIVVVAIIVLASAAEAAIAPNESNDPLISKWPEFVAWYRSHGGTSKWW